MYYCFIIYYFLFRLDKEPLSNDNDSDENVQFEMNVDELRRDMELVQEQSTREYQLQTLTSTEIDIIKKLIGVQETSKTVSSKPIDFDNEMKSEEVFRMRQTLSDAYSKLSELVDRNKDGETSDSLQSKLQESKSTKQEIEEMNNDINNLREKIEMEQELKKQRQIKLERLSVISSTLETISDDNEEQKNELLNEKESLKKELEENSSESVDTDSLQSELDEKLEKIEEFKQKLKQTQLSISRLSSAQRASMSQKSEDNPLSTLMYTIAFQEAAKAHAAYQSLEAERPKSQGDLFISFNQLSQERNQIIEKRNKQANLVAEQYYSILEKMKELEQENQNLKDDILKEKEINHQKDEELKLLKEHKENTTNHINEAELKLEQVKKELDELKKEKESHHKVLDDSKNALQELEKKILSSPATQLEKDLREREKELASISELYQTLEEENKLFEHDRQADRDKIRELQGELKAKDDVIISLRTNSPSVSRNEKQDPIRRELARLKAANHAHQAQNAQLQQEVSILNTINNNCILKFN